MENCYGIILAAGQGKRMKSKLPKVLHKICGKPMIDYVTDAVLSAGVKDFAVVVGHGADAVRDYLGSEIKTIYQDKQLGTGHAVMCCESFLNDKDGVVIILAGDAPLINSNTISNVLQYHTLNDFSATILTANTENPSGFGRIIRDGFGNVEKIVEDKDASEDEKKVKEINSGTYCFNIPELLFALKKINNNNVQGEYYLTDVIEILKKEGKKVGAYVSDFTEFMGVNSRIQLYEASVVMRDRINIRLMNEGVTIIDPKSTYIDANVKIGMDTIIYPNVIIEGNTLIGEECIIGPNSRIVDSIIENGVECQSSIILNSLVKSNAKIGPFAYIRPESEIGKEAKIGDFVEVKKSKIGDGTKIPHLTYVGDAEIGQGCNLGCGTITVNYDGTNKHKTIIGNKAFIGCNASIVAPVKIGNNAYIAAGSTITKDVPDGALAVARERQVNMEGWVERRGLWKK
ncbi:bifunctional UDP-N-acetylglucosamine diphosphorylase/glucosamine-1-phosphate N-acetyltransferase GlmU [Caloramator sp. E03]|uniref:bifunctional UDP-N-acetylglucosamine diphosphorylase/glucosamine-1-phosphate N-acetyltransferase GlmU n=1 Tax=Caloramator sp. E03 TaxID=2576307 RepID=UPI0011101DB9|nr:bifunctional UDP-N-acetylglucosamine diphosphorylase/glucosamine-1-phosphate N-acetyltransferase GlmU [Caloramator sp. E03]QCX33739.1 bifunctional UDP-N-acetylglucosamine diphosphorylase/glucosamine-1-phosphate N-acetyltransferase GlmU [Caloramator sp. E03]